MVCSEGREIEIPLRETAQPAVWPPLRSCSHQVGVRPGLLAATERWGGVQSALLWGLAAAAVGGNQGSLQCG